MVDGEREREQAGDSANPSGSGGDHCHCRERLGCLAGSWERPGRIGEHGNGHGEDHANSRFYCSDLCSQCAIGLGRMGLTQDLLKKVGQLSACPQCRRVADVAMG